MNKLSTLPVGYKPTNTGQIRTYCQGNNGYYVKNTAQIVNYDWRTDDGVLYEQERRHWLWGHSAQHQHLFQTR